MKKDPKEIWHSLQYEQRVAVNCLWALSHVHGADHSETLKYMAGASYSKQARSKAADFLAQGTPTLPRLPALCPTIVSPIHNVPQLRAIALVGLKDKTDDLPKSVYQAASAQRSNDLPRDPILVMLGVHGMAEMKKEYQSAMTGAAARRSADVTLPNSFLDRVKAQVQAAVKAGDKSLEKGGWGRGQLRTHLNRICQIAALAQSW